MVRFLLENSLGAWWAARRPDSPLLQDWEYLRFDEDGKPAAGAFEGWPATVAEVTVMDPCCGSGHFLVEAFSMLWQMRAEEEGLDPVAAQDAVLRDNLFGLELDPRCVQIAMFAVALTTWKAGGGWRELLTPNIACSGIPVRTPVEEWKKLAQGDERLEHALVRLHLLFQDADTLGSLTDPKRAVEISDPTTRQTSTADVDWDDVSPLLTAALESELDDPANVVLGANVVGTARAAGFLALRYTLITTNVPYLSRGKQAEVLREFADSIAPSTKGDLAVTVGDRCLGLATAGGSVAAVMPDKLLYLPAYRSFREHCLVNHRFNSLALLGSQAFRTPMFDLGTILLVLSRQSPNPNTTFEAIDVAGEKGPEAKQLGLFASRTTGNALSQPGQLANPDQRILTSTLEKKPPLRDVADSRYGLRSGDSNRFIRVFWEIAAITSTWRLHQGTPGNGEPFSGRETILRWDDLGGLHGYADMGIASLQGGDAWGRQGAVVKLTGDLHAGLYTGESFDNNVAVVWPRSDSDLAALWAFLSSPEFNSSVRQIDQALKVMNATLLKVPFDADRWRAVAEEQFPNGVPDPWSDDPTQWLFDGRPDVATQPLQVAVDRLLGFRWPQQVKSRDLSELADDDGIVCLPSVLGERSASDRLQELLARSFGGTWSPSRTGELLAQAGSKKKDLDTWLRDEFFKAHCKVFKNRPFVWHIWDGRKDGFAALVNYHLLDRQNLGRLTYTYLGDWIERQTAGARDDVVGAGERLAAAQELQEKLALILDGEPPYDIFIRWKALAEQPVGWDPDINDGVRMNVRPFVKAEVLRAKFGVKWTKDRGKNPDGSERHNDLHHTRAERDAARAGGPST